MPIGSASSNQADDRAPMFSLARETGQPVLQTNQALLPADHFEQEFANRDCRVESDIQNPTHQAD